MPLFSTDNLIVLGFLLITLVIGLRAGRNIKDIREYAIANKVYGTGVLTITFLATYVGGSTVIAEPSDIYKDGMIMTLSVSVQSIFMVFMAFFIAPKMKHFSGSLTMGDIMCELYGKKGQLVTGIASVFYTVCIVSAQVLALSYVYKTLLHFESQWAILLAGVIMVLYSARGGMKAVASTDMFQFFMIIILVPLLANTIVREIGGVKELFRRVPSEKLQVLSHPHFKQYAGIVFVCLFNSWLISPPFVMRMLMAKNKKQLTDMFLFCAAFDPVFKFLILLIGLGGFVLYPQMGSQNFMPDLINNLFPVGMRGLCAIGLIAVVMSTADSCLHAAGLSLARDVVQPIYAVRGRKIDELKWARYSTLLIGVLSICLALFTSNVIAMIMYGLGILSSTIMLPFLAGVMGLKTDSKSFLTSLWVTLPCFCIMQLTAGKAMGYWIFPASLFVNAASFFGMHCLQHKEALRLGQ